MGLIEATLACLAVFIAAEVWFAKSKEEDGRITRCPECDSQVKYETGWILCPNENCEWIDADYSWEPVVWDTTLTLHIPNKQGGEE